MISLSVVSEGKAEDSEEYDIFGVSIIRYRLIGVIEGHEPGGLLFGLDNHLLEGDAVLGAKATDAVIELEATPIAGEDDDIAIQDEGRHGFAFYPESEVRRREGEQRGADFDEFRGFIRYHFSREASGDITDDGEANELGEGSLARARTIKHISGAGDEPVKVNLVCFAHLGQKGRVRSS